MAGAVVIEKPCEEDLNLGISTALRTNPGGGSWTGHQINLGSFALAESVTWDPGPVLPDSSGETTTVTVSGAQVGDLVLVSHDGLWDQALTLFGYVESTNTVRVTVHNHGAGSFNPGSGTLKVLVFRVRIP